MKHIKWLIVPAILLLAGCSTQTNIPDEVASQQESASLIYTAAALTAEVGDNTPDVGTPQPQVTPTENLTPTSSIEDLDYVVPVTVELEGLALRQGPGTLFPIIGTAAKGTEVYTLGMTPDGSWINVTAPLSGEGASSGVQGWMFAQYLDLSSLEVALPINEFMPENMVSGKVVDNEGIPVEDVRVAMIVETEDGELRDENTTNLNGVFNIFFPAGLAESARVEIVAVNCNSRIAEYVVDSGCLVLDYFPTHWQETISLPIYRELEFSYEKAISYLEGKVVYQSGYGAVQILVRATRQQDGVQSEQVTPLGGAFRLPLGPGTWEVVAVRFRSDGTPLIGETRIYEVGADGEEFDPLIIPYIEIVER